MLLHHSIIKFEWDFVLLWISFHVTVSLHDAQRKVIFEAPKNGKWKLNIEMVAKCISRLQKHRPVAIKNIIFELNALLLARFSHLIPLVRKKCNVSVGNEIFNCRICPQHAAVIYSCSLWMSQFEYIHVDATNGIGIGFFSAVINSFIVSSFLFKRFIVNSKRGFPLDRVLRAESKWNGFQSIREHIHEWTNKLVFQHFRTLWISAIMCHVSIFLQNSNTNIH